MNKRTPETSTRIRAHEKRREHIQFNVKVRTWENLFEDHSID